MIVGQLGMISLLCSVACISCGCASAGFRGPQSAAACGGGCSAELHVFAAAPASAHQLAAAWLARLHCSCGVSQLTTRLGSHIDDSSVVDIPPPSSHAVSLSTRHTSVRMPSAASAAVCSALGAVCAVHWNLEYKDNRGPRFEMISCTFYVCHPA